MMPLDVASGRLLTRERTRVRKTSGGYSGSIRSIFLWLTSLACPGLSASPWCFRNTGRRALRLKYDSSISRVQGSELKTNRSSTMSFRTWYTNGSRHSEGKSSRARMVWAGYPKLSRIAWRTSVMASSDRPAPAISPSTRLPPAIPSEVRIRPIGLAATTSPPFVRPSKPSAMSRAKTSFSTYGVGRIAATIRPTRTRSALTSKAQEAYAITPDEIARSAFEAFRADAETAPPLTLRGGNAVDSYDDAEPFDAACDEATDAYIEAYAF